MCITVRLILAVGLAGTSVRGSQLPVRTYTTADGLASNFVNKIVRDSRGYLWFCTDEGLSRFDGYGFLNYSPQQGLPPRAVNDLLETRSGEYWIATNLGLCHFHPASTGRKFSLYLPDKQPIAQAITALLEDRSGRLWCGSSDGLYRFEPGHDPKGRETCTFRRIDLGVSPGRIQALAEDRHGALWIGAHNGLYRRLPGGRIDHFTTVAGLPENPISAAVEDHLGRLWVATHSGLCLLMSEPTTSRAVERIYTEKDGLAISWIITLFESTSGTLWAGTALGLSELLSLPGPSGKAFKSYSLANGLAGREHYAIGEDRDGNLWCGSEGASKITRSGFSTFSAVDGLPAIAQGPPQPHLSHNEISAANVSSVFEDPAGGLYATTAGNGRSPFLCRLEGDRFFALFPNLHTSLIGWGTHQITLQDHLGDWWIATQEGLVRFASPSHFEQLASAKPKAIYTTADGLPANLIFRIFEDSRHDLWIATHLPDGLARWDRRSASFRRYARPTDQITAFAEDTAGDVWMGMRRGGLARYRRGAFNGFGKADGVGVGAVHDIYRDQAGRLWAATMQEGVTRVDSPEAEHPHFTKINTDQGLSSQTARCITGDRWGRIYVGGGRGIDRFDPEAPTGVGHIRHYTVADGLARGEVHEAFTDRHGNIWFGTSLGLSLLVPQPDRPRLAPPVMISGLRAGGVPEPVSDLGGTDLAHIRLKPDQSHLQISFLALSFEAGEVLRYEYMLEGVDSTWSPPSDQRTVNYAGLAAGSYRFLVRAINSEGAASVRPASVYFTIVPHFWRRWWFLLLCACAVASIAYGLHRYRVAYLLQLERIRIGIATDLHDDIGASLSQIAVVSEVLSRQAADAEQVCEPLRQIAADSRELVASMSNIVWAIDPRRDHLHDLVQRMRRFASDLFTARNIQFRFSAPVLDLRLSADQRQHIFLIFKEAVNNLVRHSNCTAAEISLNVKQNIFLLEIADNGRGLEGSKANVGNGMASMQLRAQALGGRIETARHGDCGTSVALSVPLDHASKSRNGKLRHLHRG